MLNGNSRCFNIRRTSYRIEIDKDNSREEIALKIARKLLGHKEKTNEIEDRAASYFARELLLPKEILYLAIDKYEKDFNVEEVTEDGIVYEKKWYIIHTYSGYEKKVATDLEKRIEENIKKLKPYI